jgi:hypothetical protein
VRFALDARITVLEDTAMKALSIRQPWAWEIVQGIKVVEFRSWRTHYRGPFLVHAPAAVDRESLPEERRWLASHGLVLPDGLPTRGIVGITTLDDCVPQVETSLWQQVSDGLLGKRPPPGVAPRPDSKWFGASYGFHLKDAWPLPFKLYPGQLGFFSVPDDLYRSLMET